MHLGLIHVSWANIEVALLSKLMTEPLKGNLQSEYFMVSVDSLIQSTLERFINREKCLYGERSPIVGGGGGCAVTIAVYSDSWLIRLFSNPPKIAQGPMGAD